MYIFSYTEKTWENMSLTTVKNFHVEVTRHPVKSLFDSFYIPPKQPVFRNVVKGYVH